MEKLRPLEIAACSFVNLPGRGAACGPRASRRRKMKECVWVRPELVAEVEFVEWTADGMSVWPGFFFSILSTVSAKARSGRLPFFAAP
jgi:hypothetical protein